MLFRPLLCANGLIFVVFSVMSHFSGSPLEDFSYLLSSVSTLVFLYFRLVFIVSLDSFFELERPARSPSALSWDVVNVCLSFGGRGGGGGGGSMCSCPWLLEISVRSRWRFYCII